VSSWRAVGLPPSQLGNFAEIYGLTRAIELIQRKEQRGDAVFLFDWCEETVADE
jgi:hypothetical protein